MSDGHATHVRAAVFESAEIICPAPHVGCAVQLRLRWLPESWYVSLEHATHVRLTVRESAEICSPRPHLACSRHDIWRWLANS